MSNLFGNTFFFHSSVIMNFSKPPGGILLPITADDIIRF
jgi:hypothetical protein